MPLAFFVSTGTLLLRYAAETRFQFRRLTSEIRRIEKLNIANKELVQTTFIMKMNFLLFYILFLNLAAAPTNLQTLTEGIATQARDINLIPFNEASLALVTKKEQNNLVMGAVRNLEEFHKKGLMRPDIEVEHFSVDPLNGKVSLSNFNNVVTKDQFKAQLAKEKDFNIEDIYFDAKANQETSTLLPMFAPSSFIRNLPDPLPNVRYEPLDLSKFESKVIGQGIFGRVFKAQDKDGNLFAIKEFTDNQQSIKEFQNEANILHSFGLSDGKLYKNPPRQFFIKQTFIKGTSLATALKSASTGQEKDLLTKKALAAIQEFHDKGFIHSDSNPKNFIIDKSGKVHLIDYGMSVSKSEYLAWLSGTKQLDHDAALTVIKVMENRDFAELLHYPSNQL